MCFFIILYRFLKDLQELKYVQMLSNDVKFKRKNVDLKTSNVWRDVTLKMFSKVATLGDVLISV